MSDNTEIVTSDEEMSDFVCIDSPNFKYRRTGAFTPTPQSSDSFSQPAKNILHPVDDAKLSNEISLQDALLMDPTYDPDDEREVKRPALEGFEIFMNTRSKRNPIIDAVLAVSYVVAVFATGHFLAQHFNKKSRQGYSPANIKLLTWKSYNETCSLVENLFFDSFESVTERNLLPGPAKVRLLSSSTKVTRELLPSGKARIYLDAYEPKALSQKMDANKKLDENGNTGFYVICEGEQMKCQCVRIVIMVTGKEPKYQRRCICEPLDEGEPTFEMTASSRSRRTALMLPKFTSLSEFVLAFNKYLHFSYNIFVKAKQIIKRVAFTLKRSSQLTFSQFKISIVDLYKKCDADTVSRIWKRAKTISRPRCEGCETLRKKHPAFRAFKKGTRRFGKLCKYHINRASCAASRWTSKVAEQVEPTLKEYHSLLKAQLARA
jgi:hypothetical protein